ncbi:MAG: 5-dehydro-2-deoxygluconokinase [Pseudomonadota bacterium]
MVDLTRLSSGQFLIIGRAGMDFYADPPGTRLEDGARFVTALGGSSANIAAGLCKLGCAAALVTCVSDDPVGIYCENQLDHYGIDRRFVRRVGGEARNSLAVVDTNGDATQAVIYRNGAADFEMAMQDVVDLPYGDYAALITTGTVLAAEPSRAATLHAFEAAKAAGLMLIFDVDYRPYSWASADEAAAVYSRAGALCDIIIGNDVEFGFMAGDYDRGLAKARALAAEGKLVVYKMGHLGSIVLTGDDEQRYGIYQTDAIKPTGAGDSFMAGLISSLAEGRPFAEAISRGSAAAAMVVARVGCAPAMPDPEELDAFLADNGQLART